ncbi:MAG: hypothetical protein UY16_C0006G0007 [Candidatus Gottesmanbacteria bacterium GW2011_GWA2_47_9]|uniref:Uncharacterized protein n=1 Tax=Candidatus Gottesmanbacteria bacterium GW2011_GWA2_47_9 TaxID=1618445 RepID=A0A0G1U343_9BACT|nr:MAG: hypothetical protein UY16_C0006G0007 [Candidatus Gottesmanbacteria bacterium GW2011_GWA2_47_9]
MGQGNGPEQQSKNITPWDQIDGSPPVESWREPTRQHPRVDIDFEELDADIAASQQPPIDEDTRILPTEELVTPIEIFAGHVWSMAGEPDISPLGEPMQNALIYVLADTPGEEKIEMFANKLFAFMAPLETTWLLANERSDKELRAGCMRTIGTLILDPRVPQSDRESMVRRFTPRPSDLMTYAKVVLEYVMDKDDEIGQPKSVARVNVQAAFGALVSGFVKMQEGGLVPMGRRDVFKNMELLMKTFKHNPESGDICTMTYRIITQLETEFLQQGK